MTLDYFYGQSGELFAYFRISCTMQRALTLSRPTLNWQEWKSPL